jgi:hypothetical protein
MMLFVNLDCLPCGVERTASADFIGVLVAPIRDENKNRRERLGHDQQAIAFKRTIGTGGNHGSSAAGQRKTKWTSNAMGGSVCGRIRVV